jgi:hypothetical protein
MAVTKERKEKLKKSLDLLNQIDPKQLTKQRRHFFLAGFCLGKWDEDIIYQMCYSFGRDLIIEIEKFLEKHKDD